MCRKNETNSKGLHTPHAALDPTVLLKLGTIMHGEFSSHIDCEWCYPTRSRSTIIVLTSGVSPPLDLRICCLHASTTQRPVIAFTGEYTTLYTLIHHQLSQCISDAAAAAFNSKPGLCLGPASCELHGPWFPSKGIMEERMQQLAGADYACEQTTTI